MWPDNWPVIILFCELATCWKETPNGIFIDYPSLSQMASDHKGSKAELIEGVNLMQYAVAEHRAEK